MIIEIPNENSIIKWKNNTYDKWKVAEISDLIKAYERPQGEWIEVTKGIDSNTYKCPFCGRLINCDKPRLKLYPFCHCGADMRGEKE